MFALALDIPPASYLTKVMYPQEAAAKQSSDLGRVCLEVRYSSGCALSTSRYGPNFAEKSLALDGLRPEESRTLAYSEDEAWIDYQPKTALGRKLLELRRAYLASGGALLSAEALDEEIRVRRGETSDD